MLDNSEVVDRVAGMWLSTGESSLDELHKPFADAFKHSKQFQVVLGTLAAQIVVWAARDDDYSVIASMLGAVELGYKLRMTEELEELASK